MLSRLWSRAGKQTVSAGANACRQARGGLGGYSSAVVRPNPLIFPGLVDVKARPLADIFARGYHIHAAGGEVPVQEQFDALIKGKEMKLLLTKIQSSDDIETHRDDIAAMAEKLRVLIDRGASTMTISADGKDVLVN